MLILLWSLQRRKEEIITKAGIKFSERTAKVRWGADNRRGRREKKTSLFLEQQVGL